MPAKKPKTLQARIDASKRRPRFYTAEQCDYRVGAKMGWLRRTRSDGSHYSIPMLIGGDRCEEPAVVTYREDSKTIKRCVAHNHASYY